MRDVFGCEIKEGVMCAALVDDKLQVGWVDAIQVRDNCVGVKYKDRNGLVRHALVGNLDIVIDQGVNT